MSDLRLAVIGAGHLGKIHARLAAERNGARLTAVVEPNEAVGREVAVPLGAVCAATWQEAAHLFDAAIVAAPTSLHYNIGVQLLQAGKHVLMEKPLCDKAEAAAQLVNAAQSARRVLQVGHIERFNPAFTSAAPLVSSPRFIDAARESAYTGRSTDVGVVLDLMIHDIDLVLSVVDSPLQRVSAVGAAVVGPHEDMAQAWLEFANGAVATLRASRVSHQPQRTMNIIGPFAEVAIDFGQRKATTCKPSLALMGQRAKATAPPPEFATAVQTKHLRVRPVETPADVNPLADEQQDFVDAVRYDKLPRVTGDDGHLALFVAEEILAAIASRAVQTRRQPTWPLRTRAA